MPDFEIAGYRLTKIPGSPNWYATWYENGRSKRASLRCSNIEEAKQKLAAKVLVNRTMRSEKPEEVLLSTVFARYWEGHAKKLPSADVSQRALKSWMDYWGAAVISNLTANRQSDFIEWMQNRGWSNEYINRTITVGQAALNHAYKNQEIASAPFIKKVPSNTVGRERILTIEESARLFQQCKPGSHNFMYLIIAFNTLARPGAILDLGPRQVNLKYRLIDLLTPGATQNKKRRPTIPITKTLLPWIQSCSADTFIHWHGKKVLSNKKAFATLVKSADVGCNVVRYTIRHTMATEMRRQKVGKWELDGWLGHTTPGTTERYAKFDPDYMSDGAKVIDNYMDQIQYHIDYPLVLADI